MDIQALLEILLVVTVYLTICYQSIFKKRYRNIFLPATVIFFILVRSRDFFTGYYNPDELQWIISANSIKYNPSEYFSYFFFSEFSRVLTILPLTLIGIFSDYIGYFETRLLNILLFCVFLCLQYFILNKIFRNKHNSKIVLLILTFCISFGHRGDLYCYNSEIVVLVLMSISLYYYLCWEHTNSILYLFITSAIICLVPFAKDQALPVSLGLFFYLLIINRGNPKHLIYMLIFPTLISILFISHIFFTDSFGKVMLLIHYANFYSKTGLSINSSSFAIKSLDFLKNNFTEIFNGVLLILALIGSVFLFWRKFVLNKKFPKITIIYALLSILIIYITIYPGNCFYHYSLFFYLVYPFFIYMALVNVKKYRTWFLFLILFLILKSGIIHNKTFFPLSGYFLHHKTVTKQDEVGLYLSQNLKKNDYLMVWGWDLEYYLQSKAQRSTFAIVPVFLDSKSKDKIHWINLYISDISKYKPKFILETVGPDRFYFSDKKIWSIENVSKKLMNKIKNSYTLTKSGENFRVFKIKS